MNLTRRGFIGALLAAPLVAKVAPSDLMPALSTALPKPGVTSFGILNAQQMLVWSTAIWESTDFGHIRQATAEFEIDETVVVDEVVVYDSDRYIRMPFAAPRHLTAGDQLRVAFQTHT